MNIFKRKRLQDTPAPSPQYLFKISTAIVIDNKKNPPKPQTALVMKLQIISL